MHRGKNGRARHEAVRENIDVRKGKGGQDLHCSSARHMLAHGEAVVHERQPCTVLYQHRLPCVRLWLVHGSLLSGLHSMENAFPGFTLSDRKFSSVPTQNAVGTGFACAGRLYFAGRQCHPVRPTDENRYLIQPNRVTTITHQTVTTNQTKGDPPK